MFVGDLCTPELGYSNIYCRSARKTGHEGHDSRLRPSKTEPSQTDPTTRQPTSERAPEQETQRCSTSA